MSDFSQKMVVFISDFLQKRLFLYFVPDHSFRDSDDARCIMKCPILFVLSWKKDGAMIVFVSDFFTRNSRLE
jgi:hypothetical protein